MTAEHSVSSGKNKKLLLYDGDCSMCSSFVRFVIKNNTSGNIRIANLNALVAMEGSSQEPFHSLKPLLQLNTVYFLSERKLFNRSTAVLKVLSELGGIYSPLSRLLLWMPKGLRDGMYRIIAKNRHRLFSRGQSCAIYSPGEQELFLSPEEARKILRSALAANNY